MGYVSLYRKYRSQSFDDLMGQHHVVRTLQNGIRSGRIAHAYLFTGPRGTGKTSTARLLAKALCCEKGPTSDPCNACENCSSITAGSFIDVYEMDAASEAGVEEVRERIVATAEFPPMLGRYKVFIIDEVHDLSPKAFDALLKTIEEPPAHAIFILATTEYTKVPATIRSRCQKYEFHRASLDDLGKRLEYVVAQEGAQAEPSALAAIARMADGGFRDALTLLEQALITSDGPITQAQVYDQLGLVTDDTVDAMLLAIVEQRVPDLLSGLDDVLRRGRDPRAVLESMMYRLAELTRTVYQVEDGNVDAPRQSSSFETAQRIGRDTLLRLRSQVSEAHVKARDVTLPRIWLEAELCRLATWTPSTAAPSPRASAPQPPSQPAPKRPEPKASAPPDPQTAPQTAPVAPEAKPDPQPAKKAPPPPAANGEATDVWQAVLAQVPLESPMGMKLMGSELVSRQGAKVTVGVKGAMVLEWLQDQAKRQAHLRKLLQEAAGEELLLEFVVLNKEHRMEEPAAVELPLEGEKLDKAARSVLLPEQNTP